MEHASFFAFVLAATALAIVPGPTVTVIIANSLKHGTRAGLLNVLGTQIGVVIWLGVAALGLGAAIKLMGVWFDLVRYIGAAYLIWLGIKMYRSKGDLALATERARPGGSFLLQGLIVILSNPKMLVLFGALIPPFIPQGSDVMWSTLRLGLTFAGIALGCAKAPCGTSAVRISRSLNSDQPIPAARMSAMTTAMMIRNLRATWPPVLMRP